MAHPLAGRRCPPELLVDPAELLARFANVPDARDPSERVSFGTSGHRGTSLRRSFQELHIAAIAQAVCDVRASLGATGPLFVGKDTHFLSGPAEDVALDVLVANGVEVVLDDSPYVPTPVISHAILAYNRAASASGGALADGLVLTPSHNPPSDGGIKYDPTTGGPADTSVTNRIQARANDLLEAEGAGIRRATRGRAAARALDLVGAYLRDLEHVVDMNAIVRAGVRAAVDPLGGASVGVWQRVARELGVPLDVVSSDVDPRFARVPVDHDGKIRMDCSSPFAMSEVVALRERYDVAIGNDADADRHGIVTRSAGLLNPNHFLAVCVDYLFRHRSEWPSRARVGKTLVSSSLLDRVAAEVGRAVVEVPVGFKWFTDGLLDGTLGFAGEESAGASLLRRDGSVWTTDKDGVALGLLALEIRAVLGVDPGEAYRGLVTRLGESHYTRVDGPLRDATRKALATLDPARLPFQALAGDPVQRALTRAPGNGAAIGGLKVETSRAWFAVRPSGTEPVLKLYAESSRSAEHLEQVVAEASAFLDSLG